MNFLRWTGLGLSALLLVGAAILWVRSFGHFEQWVFTRFEPRPDWTMPGLVGKGIGREWYAEAVHGWLWLGSGTGAPMSGFKPGSRYQRDPILADHVKERFDSIFPPRGRPSGRGTARVWRFAGAGFSHVRDAVDSQIGRPPSESFTLVLPFWMPTLLFGLWPTLFVGRRLLWRKRFAKGLCSHCGYDLRATPQRCPECGRKAVAKCV